MRYLTKQITLVLVVLAAAVPQDTVARQRTRDAFWIEVSGGTGGAIFNCSECENPIRTFGESGYTRIGGEFSDYVLWGIEVYTLLSKSFNVKDGGENSVVEVTSIAPIVLWYPFRNRYYFKAGFGISRGEISKEAGEFTPLIRARGTGSGMTFGLGLDFPVLKWLALTVGGDIYFGAVGDVEVDGVQIDDLISTTYNLNFGLALR